jgi:hypothetical protein
MLSSRIHHLSMLAIEPEADSERAMRPPTM